MNPYAPPTTPSAGPGDQATVPVPGLEGRVFVRERTFWGKPGFVVDGAFRPTVRGVLELPDAEGRVRRLSLRGFPLDPCPRVVVDGVVVDAFPRLPLWASALCCVPLVLLGEGLLGGTVAIVTIYGNFRIARSRLPPVLRGVAGALLTVGAGEQRRPDERPEPAPHVAAQLQHPHRRRSEAAARAGACGIPRCDR